MILRFLRVISRLLWQPAAQWQSRPVRDFSTVRLFALLNHTSLFEPLLLGAFPTALIREMSRRMVYPIADQTFNRPIAGRFFRILAPGTIPLTRSRDRSWDRFVHLATTGNSLVGIAPEGRMKRANGLDKNGRPMNIKTGIADLLEKFDSGSFLILYSAGLHHIQSPGSGMPKMFKPLSMKFELLDIKEYKNKLKNICGNNDRAAFARTVAKDLEKRRDTHCPASPTQARAKRPQASSTPKAGHPATQIP